MDESGVREFTCLVLCPACRAFISPHCSSGQHGRAAILTEPGHLAWVALWWAYRPMPGSPYAVQVLTIAVDAVLRADPGEIWRAWRPDYPMRPAEEESRNQNLYGLAYGLRIPVTLVAVYEMRSWTVEHRLPGGKLVIQHWMAPIDAGRVRVGKRYEVRGPMSVAYRILAPGIRRSAQQALTALAREASGGA